MSETFTNDLHLSKFDQGDNPGATKLNANWTKIDGAVMGHGTAFPSTYIVGKLFLREDQEIIYKNTGSQPSPVWAAVLDFSTLGISDIVGLSAALATITAAITTINTALTTKVDTTDPRLSVVTTGHDGLQRQLTGSG